MAGDPNLFSDSSDSEVTVMSAINVTPFVDVVLVLLVIFMVTAPLINKNVFDITLPKASTGEQKIVKNISIAVTKKGQMLLDGQLITSDALLQSAKQAFANDPEIQALISADGDARQADVVKAIDVVRTAGIQHFAFQVEKP